MKSRDDARIEEVHSDKLAFTIDQACAAAGLGRNSIYDLMNSGTLPSRRVAGRRLILREDLLAVLRGGK
jgi:excisionase family DNA binding protein